VCAQQSSATEVGWLSWRWGFGVRKRGDCRDDLDGGLFAVSSLWMEKIKERKRGSRSRVKRMDCLSEQSGGDCAGAGLVGWYVGLVVGMHTSSVGGLGRADGGWCSGGEKERTPGRWCQCGMAGKRTTAVPMMPEPGPRQASRQKQGLLPVPKKGGRSAQVLSFRISHWHLRPRRDLSAAIIVRLGLFSCGVAAIWVSERSSQAVVHLQQRRWSSPMTPPHARVLITR
jgi:hypothetical protein